MNNTLLKKVTASAAALSIVLSVVAPVVGVKAADASVDAANRLAALNVIEDHSNNPSAYNLGSSITRREMLKVMMNLSSVEVTETCTGKFSDLNKSDWGCKYAEAALEAGFIAANARFRPNDMVTEAEALKMVMQARGVEAAEGVEPWGEAYRVAAVEAGILSADSKISATSAAKRSFVFIAADDAVNVTTGENAEDDEDEDFNFGGIFDDLFGDDKDEDKEEGVEGEDKKEGNENNNSSDVKAGDVEVTLNPASSKGGTIPSKGQVTFATYDFTAGSRDISLDGVKLQRNGLSNRSDISRVYFEVKGKRVSSRASINIDDEAIVSFTPAVVVKAGSTVSLDLIVVLSENSATTGAEHSFSVVSVESSAANVSGKLPVNTATMRIGSYAVQDVNFLPTTGSSEEVNVGDTNKLLGEFDLQTKGDKDNVFKSVTLRNNGRADLESSLANLAIYRDGKAVSTETIISGREVTFVVNDEIENGRKEAYEIRADIISTDNDGDDVQFELRNNEDLVVVEKSTQFSAPVSALNGRAMVAYKIKGGELLISRDTTITTNRTVSASTSDVVLLSANIRVDEAVTIEDLKIKATATGTGLYHQYRDLKLVVDGRTVSTYTPKSDDTGTGNVKNTVVFDGTFMVTKNSRLQVLGNLKNSVTNGATLQLDNLVIKVDGDDSTVTDIRYVSNDERPLISAGVYGINGTAQGVKVTVQDSTLLFTKADGLSDGEEIIAGAKDVRVVEFRLRANDVSDVRVTSMNPKVVYSTGIDRTKVNNVRLYSEGELLSTKNNFDFNSLSVTIARNTSKTFTIVADFDTSIDPNATFNLEFKDSVVARNVESNENITAPTDSVSSAKLKMIGNAEVLVTRNSSTPSANVFVPGDAEKTVLSFDVEAKKDKIRFTDLYLTSSGTLNLADAVKSVSLVSGNKTVQGDVIDGKTIYFAIGEDSAIVINRDEIKKFDVKIAFNGSDTRQKEKFQLVIGDGTAGVVSGTVNGMRLLSDSVGTELDASNMLGGVNVESNTHLLARTSVVVADGKAERNTQAFSVTADKNRQANIKELSLDISVGSATLSDKDLGGLALYVNNYRKTGLTFGLTGSVLTISGINEDVSAGRSSTFEIRDLNKIITDTTKDSSRTIKVVGVKYNTGIASDDVTLDNNTNEYVNTGVPSNGVTFSNY